MKTLCLVFCFLLAASPLARAQNYEALTRDILAVKAEDPASKLSPQQLQVRSFWKTGKLLDDYLLERSEHAVELVNRLALDLKEDSNRIYYALQFARAYPDSPPALDLPWGFYQYLLAINDARERGAVAQRAYQEKWTWDQLRAEVKTANRDNKIFVFTDTPGKTGVYRVMKARRGSSRGKLVLDLGFSVYRPLPENVNLNDYEIVEAQCAANLSSPHALSGDSWIPASAGMMKTSLVLELSRAGLMKNQPGMTKTPECVFKPDADGEKDLFTYPADVVRVIDGDTFEAVIDLGFGLTTLQTFRLWRLDAPEINTQEGRETKKVLEGLLLEKPVLLRAMRMEKYGRYLADVFVNSAKPSEAKAPEGQSRMEPPAYTYVNQLLLDRGLAKKMEQEMH